MRASRSEGTLHPVAAFALTGAGVALMLGAGATVGPLLGRAGLDGGDVLRAQIALGSALLLLPTLLAILALRGSSWRTVLSLGRLPPQGVALSVFLGAALWVGSIGLMELQAVPWPPSPEYLEAFRAIHRALAPEGPLDALVSVTVIALLPALAEELVVRGALLPSLVRPLGPILAVVASSALFALMHDPYRYLFTLAVGLVLGAARLRTGSLWPSITAHATLNTLTFLVAPLVDDPAQTTYQPQPLLGLAFLLAGAASALPLLKALRRFVDGSRGPA
jgi:membrane protease YdiL (CAAX protease family)